MTRTNQTARKPKQNANRSQNRVIADLVNELLGAFQSEQHPWKSNLEVIDSIITELHQIERPASGCNSVNVTYSSTEYGEKRYNERVELAESLTDVRKFKKAMEDTMKQLEAYENAELEDRGARGKKRPRSDAECDARDALRQQMEALYKAGKRLKVGNIEDEATDDEQDHTVDGATVDDDSENELTMGIAAVNGIIKQE